jgi:hypothetical protein
MAMGKMRRSSNEALHSENEVCPFFPRPFFAVAKLKSRKVSCQSNNSRGAPW